MQSQAIHSQPAAPNYIPQLVQLVQVPQIQQIPPPPYPIRTVNESVLQTHTVPSEPIIYSSSASDKEADSKPEPPSEEKSSILKHPLFPLMASLYGKCEQATLTSKCPNTESINTEINSFFNDQHNKKPPLLLKSGRVLLVGDEEIDQLMIKAIQVLRIHLLELEKVNDLCQDFCSRYITSLKSQLQNERLLRVDDPEFDSPVSSPTALSPQITPSVVAGGGTVFQMIQTPQGLVAAPLQIQAATMPSVFKSQPSLVPLKSRLSSKPTESPPLVASDVATGKTDIEPQRRGILPRHATQTMKSWLFQHIVHPYPSEDEKKELSLQTGLSILQINNWFINARRRILQPMLQETTDNKQTKKLKSPQTRPPTQKFWPQHLAVHLNSEEEVGDSSSVQEQPDIVTAAKGFVINPELYDVLQVQTDANVQDMISNVQHATSQLMAHSRLTSSVQSEHDLQTSDNSDLHEHTESEPQPDDDRQNVNNTDAPQCDTDSSNVDTVYLPSSTDSNSKKEERKLKRRKLHY